MTFFDIFYKKADAEESGKENTQEESINNHDKSIFKYNDIPNPQDFYATSKLEAEQILWDISKNTELEVVVVRLPLVYGSEVKGNLLRLKKLINSGNWDFSVVFHLSFLYKYLFLLKK